MIVPTFGSLFAGIGGIDLGLERAGWSCKWQVENNTYCLRILEKHWPTVKRYGNIKRVDPAELEQVDLIAGGFPCQPTSYAGKRLGDKDPRWLWPEMLRIIRGVRPRFVLVENPPGLYTKGFGQVLGDLATLGYDAEWDCLPAAAFGAPHLRYRIFVVAWDVAHTKGMGWKDGDTTDDRQTYRESHSPSDGGEVLAYTCGERRQQISRSSHANENQNEGRSAIQADQSECHGEGRRERVMADTSSQRFEEHRKQDSNADTDQLFVGCPTKSDYWAVEPNVGRVAHGVPFGVDRLEALGNACVPQVVEWVGRRILAWGASTRAGVHVKW